MDTVIMQTDTLGIIPVIIAINEGLKQLGMPSKFAIVVAWGLSVGFSVVDAYQKHANLLTAILSGFLIGSAASGIYDAGRVVADKVRGPQGEK